jgi:hypothetical protein
MFIHHEFNREINEESKNFKALVESMRDYGWLDSFPASCIENGRGLKIIAGHNRFRAAEILGLPVKYVVEKIEVPIHRLEKGGPGRWTTTDYLRSYTKKGVDSYVELSEYMDRTGISLANAASMFYGDSAGSGNYHASGDFANGKFRIKDRVHPAQVEGIVKYLKNIGVSFASENLIVKAISRILRVEEFRVERFKSKSRVHVGLFQKQKNLQDYIKMFEDIYNRQCQNKQKVPLSFLVEQKMVERNAVMNRRKH